jgi:hypothetical protein
MAHQTFGLATHGRNTASLDGHGAARQTSSSLEGWSPPWVGFRLARGPVAPLGRGPASPEGWTPPRARFLLARGPHGPAASIPTPPIGAFNALTFASAQVKDESTPRRAWESHPGTALPTPPVRPSLPLCDAVRHGQQQPRGTVPPTPVRPTRRTLKKGRWSPRREDERLRRARTRTTP